MLLDLWSQVNGLEAVAVVFGLAYVVLSIRQSVWCWPAGLVNVSLFLVLFYQARLYADMGLQGVYIVLSLYGWWHWLYGGPGRQEAPVTRTPRGEALLLAALTAGGTLALGTALGRLTDADLPYWDSLTTCLSLAGQWLTARKRLENWLVWIVADALYVGIFFYKGLYLTLGQYAVFLVLAVAGYVAWKRTLSAPPAPALGASS